MRFTFVIALVMRMDKQFIHAVKIYLTLKLSVRIPCACTSCRPLKYVENMEQSTYGMCLDVDHYSSVCSDWFRTKKPGHLFRPVSIWNADFLLQKAVTNGKRVWMNDNWIAWYTLFINFYFPPVWFFCGDESHLVWGGLSSFTLWTFWQFQGSNVVNILHANFRTVTTCSGNNLFTRHTMDAI